MPRKQRLEAFAAAEGLNCNKICIYSVRVAESNRPRRNNRGSFPLLPGNHVRSEYLQKFLIELVNNGKKKKRKKNKLETNEKS